MPARVQLIGLGMHVPETSLTNEEIERSLPWLDTSAQWIAEHTGICARRIADPHDHVTDLGIRAALEAVRLSRIDPRDIDLVLLATNTAREIYPAGAGRIQQALGVDAQGNLRAFRAGALDLQQGCSSFVGGIGLAAALIRGGGFRTVLVVGADVASRMVDWTNRDAVLLGDGATAAVLTGEAAPSGMEQAPLEILAHFMRTDPRIAEAIAQKGPLNPRNHPLAHARRGRIEGRTSEERRRDLYGPEFFGSMADDDHCFFRMEGRKVYRFVKRVIPRQGYLEVLRASGLLSDAPPGLELDRVASLEDVEDRERRMQIAAYLTSKVGLFIPHSANLALNEDLAEEMAIPMERMYLTLQKYGNTSAASVGLSLYEALRQPCSYRTLTRRDGRGEVVVAARDVAVPALAAGQIALLLSFGAGNSWNFVAARRA